MKLIHYVLVFIIVAVFFLILIGIVNDSFKRTSVTGKVVRTWIQGDYGYATLRQSDGTLSAYYVQATDYGVLSVGETCTFMVNGTAAKSVSCQAAQ